jgi:NTE family protein
MTELITGLGYSSKTVTERAFARMLREKRRHTARAFLTAHCGDLGRRSIANFEWSSRRN